MPSVSQRFLQHEMTHWLFLFSASSVFTGSWLMQFSSESVQHRAAWAHRKWDWREQERQRLCSAVVTSAQNRPWLCALATGPVFASHRWSMRGKEKGEEKKTGKDKKVKGAEEEEGFFQVILDSWWNITRLSITAFWSSSVARSCIIPDSWLQPWINTIKV